MRSGSAVIFIALGCIALAACGRTYVAEEVPNRFEMPAGATLQVKLVNPERVADIEAGEKFDGVLAEPLYYRREELDPQGKMFEKESLVAPVGAPVAGEGVAAPEAGVGLQLDLVTFHGGMSFPIKTDVIVPPAADESSSAENETADEAEPLTFTLAEPADVALAIDFRENENPNE
jgi:hypothetical protein